VKIVFDKREFDRAYSLVQQWKDRARAVRKQFLYLAVDKIYDDLLGFIPSERKTLRQSLQMQKVRGLPDSEDAYVIHSRPRSREVSKENSNTTVIYVSSKPNLMQKVPDAVKILEEFSPWTFDTLPYVPDPKTSEVMSRKVSPREVNRVRRLRQRDKPAWRRQLKEAGVREVTRIFQPRPKGLETVPDTAFESLRLEFGLGGAPSKPHWRRAILKLALRGGAGMIARKREFERAMTDPSYLVWKRWPTKTEGYATVAEAKKYIPFQKRLGLKVGK